MSYWTNRARKAYAGAWKFGGHSFAPTPREEAEIVERECKARARRRWQPVVHATWRPVTGDCEKYAVIRGGQVVRRDTLEFWRIAARLRQIIRETAGKEEK